jgi:hypothetical protein
VPSGKGLIVVVMNIHHAYTTTKDNLQQATLRAISLVGSMLLMTQYMPVGYAILAAADLYKANKPDERAAKFKSRFNPGFFGASTRGETPERVAAIKRATITMR